MNIRNHFEAFVSLSTIDQQFLSLQRTLDSLEKNSENLKAALNAATRSLQEKHLEFSTNQKKLADLELDLRAIFSSIMKKQKQLEVSSSTREYQSLTNEIAELELKKSHLEENILTLWQQIEDQQELLKQLIIKSDAATVQIAQEQNKNDAAIAEIKAQMSVLKNDAEALYNDLNPLILTNYLQMKEKVPNPGVQVVDGRCGGCYYPVSSQDLADLRKHKILACKDCYRLLYMR